MTAANEAKTLVPSMLWAQRKDHLYLTMEVNEPTDVKFDLEEPNKLHFAATNSTTGQKYAVDLEFFGDIDKENSKQRVGRVVEFSFKKKQSGYWDRLLKDKTLKDKVKVDWDKWKDEDEEKEEDFDWGNGSGFDGSMSDDEESISDDDDGDKGDSAENDILSDLAATGDQSNTDGDQSAGDQSAGDQSAGDQSAGDQSTENQSTENQAQTDAKPE